MSRTVSLPDAIVQHAEELAARARVPVEEYLTEALLEQFSHMERLRKRAERASEESFRAALAEIPDTEPEDYDRLD